MKTSLNKTINGINTDVKSVIFMFTLKSAWNCYNSQSEIAVLN